MSDISTLHCDLTKRVGLSLTDDARSIQDAFSGDTSTEVAFAHRHGLLVRFVHLQTLTYGFTAENFYERFLRILAPLATDFPARPTTSETSPTTHTIRSAFQMRVAELLGAKEAPLLLMRGRHAQRDIQIILMTKKPSIQEEPVASKEDVDADEIPLSPDEAALLAQWIQEEIAATSSEITLAAFDPIAFIAWRTNREVLMDSAFDALSKAHQEAVFATLQWKK